MKTVVTAANCFDVARECGILPWQQARPIQSEDEFFATASDQERSDYNRFAPKVNVVHHLDQAGNPFTGFTVKFKDYATVFALIDGMLPVTAEWKHGNDKVTFVPVCGVASKAEAHIDNMSDKMQAVAEREFLEETGYAVKNLRRISPASGMWAIVRQAHVQCYPFVGEVDMSVPQGPSKLDSQEQLQILLFPLKEWIKLISDPHAFDDHPEFCLEACARDLTYAALMELGMMTIHLP